MMANNGWWFKLYAGWHESAWLQELDYPVPWLFPALLEWMRISGKNGRCKVHTVRKMAAYFGAPVEHLTALIEAAERGGCLLVQDGEWGMVNWDAYQQSDSAERMRKLRAQQDAEHNRHNADDVTHSPQNVTHINGGVTHKPPIPVTPLTREYLTREQEQEQENTEKGKTRAVDTTSPPGKAPKRKTKPGSATSPPAELVTSNGAGSDADLAATMERLRAQKGEVPPASDPVLIGKLAGGRHV